MKQDLLIIGCTGRAGHRILERVRVALEIKSWGCTARRQRDLDHVNRLYGDSKGFCGAHLLTLDERAQTASDTLISLIGNFRVILNCTPFCSSELFHACLSLSGTHLVELARFEYEKMPPDELKAEHELAVQRDVCVVRGCALYPGLTEVAVQMLRQRIWPGDLTEAHALVSLAGGCSIYDLSRTLWRHLIDTYAQLGRDTFIQRSGWDVSAQRWSVDAGSGAALTTTLALATPSMTYFVVIWFFFWLFLLAARTAIGRRIMLLVRGIDRRQRVSTWSVAASNDASDDDDIENDCAEASLTTMTASSDGAAATQRRQRQRRSGDDAMTELLVCARGYHGPWVPVPHDGAPPREFVLTVRGRDPRDGLYSLVAGLAVAVAIVLLDVDNANSTSDVVVTHRRGFTSCGHLGARVVELMQRADDATFDMAMRINDQ